MHLPDVLIAFGANRPSVAGEPAETLKAAFNSMVQRGIFVDAISPVYSTPAFPQGSGPDFLNGCARIRAEMPLPGLMAELHAVELEFGRTRFARWAPRAIDLDLLAAGRTVLPDAATQTAWRQLPRDRQMEEAPRELVLPHPRLADRAFVLVPLADIAPDWRHPLTGASVTEMLAALDPAERAAIRRVS